MNMKHETRELMSRISIKALVLSNVAFWAFVGSGVILTSALYWGGVALSSRIASASAAGVDQIPPALLGAWIAVCCLAAPLLAGYLAAKIAPHAKLLNAVLATSTWLLFSVYSDVFVGGSDATWPWLDMLGSYWVPIPALMGAYLWQWRASSPSLVAQA
jgi:hypothetical protein